MSFYHQEDCENWPCDKVSKFVPSTPCQETDTLGGVYTNKPDDAKENSVIENLIEQLTVTASGVGEYSKERDAEGHRIRNNKLSLRGTAYIIKCLRQYAEIQKIVEEYSKNDQYADIPEYFVKILDIFKENK